MPRSTIRFYPAWLATGLAGWASGCGGLPTDVPPPPPPPPPSLAVTSINPTSAFRDVTLDVHLLGSGFEQGSRAVWALGTDTAFATTKVKTNSTSFVNAGELVANITIQPDAPIGSYGMLVVTTSGKKSSGNVQFGVALSIELVDLGTGDNSLARGVNNQGQIVGDRGADPATVQAFLWDNDVITNLGVLPGMTYSYAFDINASGQVVGVSGTGTLDNPILQRGFIWTATGGIQALSTLGGISSARAINDNGDIAGFSTVSGTNTQQGHAVVWRNGVVTDLQPASFANDVGRAFAINNSGEVVGWVYSRLQAFKWTATGVMVPLEGGLPFGINDAGCVAGWSASGGVTAGYRICAGVSRNVGNCGGSGSRAWAINSGGDVAGDASNGGGQQAAFLWTETGGITCFPIPQGSDGAGATDVNDASWVVGTVNRPVGGGHATLWKVK